MSEDKEQLMIVLVSKDPDIGKWNYVLPNDVPEWLKDPSAMGRLVAGEILQAIDETVFYRGEAVEAVEV